MEQQDRLTRMREELKDIEIGLNGYQENSAFFVLQGKWKSLILSVICIREQVQFGELKKALPGITNAMLTNALRDMEKRGMIRRVQYNEIPPHVEYLPTKKGNDMLPVFYEMYHWTMKYMEEEGGYQQLVRMWQGKPKTDSSSG